MDSSILTSIKKLLGITEDYEHFDQDIIMHINGVLFVLNQLGIGASKGFIITDKSETWADFVSEDYTYKVGMLQVYVYMKVRLVFDPPQSSAAMKAMEELIKEYEWRLNIEAESNEEE